MRLSDEFDEQNNSTPSPLIFAIIPLVALFVGGILILVLVINKPEREGVPVPQPTIGLQAQSPIITDKTQGDDMDGLLSGSSLSPDDLDFWDKYPQDTPQPEETTVEEPVEEEPDPSTDGKHTLVEKQDGSQEWVMINPYLPKHEYDFTKLVSQSGLLKYYSEGKQISYVGADVSKIQDYIDFTKARKAGLDFVMVRVGARGYSSGQLVADDYFTENAKRASDAGLQVGVYFFSQAINEEEAVEEANFVLEAIKDYHITYPVAFYMDEITGDSSRIDKLSKNAKTNIAKAFLETVKGAGYIPMIYGDKEWLLTQIDLSKLTAYDIWFSQLKDLPDYPYRFSMWQYSTTGTIDGIAGYTDLNISFIDYTEK